MTDRTSRIMVLPGLPNVRDCGGLPGPGRTWLQRRILLRGPAPSEETAQALESLGIRTVVDLRSAAEREAEDGPGHMNARVLPRPVSGDMSGISGVRRPAPSAYLANYRSMLTVAAPVVAEVISLLAEPASVPVYVCCTVGKDRTGVVTALILRGLGVRLAAIARDYALTGRSYRALRPRDPRPDWSYDGSLEELQIRTAAPTWIMRTLLSGIESEHQSVGHYLEQYGLAAETRRQAVRRVFEQCTRQETKTCP